MQINGDENKVVAQGIVNFAVLKENRDNFLDPTTKSDYSVAFHEAGLEEIASLSTAPRDLSLIELATINEEHNTAVVIGDYFPREEGDTKGLIKGEDGEILVNEGEGANIGGGTPPPSAPSCDDTSKPADNGNIVFTEGTPIQTNQTWIQDATNCGYTCKENYSGTDCATFTPPNGTTIITGGGTENGFTWKDLIFSYNGTSYTIMDRNYGATTAYDGTSSEPTSNVLNSASYFGNYYQWGSTSTDLINDSAGPGTTWTEGEANGICPSGRHIPNTAEWDGLMKLWFQSKGVPCTVAVGGTCDFGTGTATITNFKNELKLPLAGRRSWKGPVDYQGTTGNYWSSSPNGSSAYCMNFYSSLVYPQNTNSGIAYSVRCFKD